MFLTLKWDYMPLNILSRHNKFIHTPLMIVLDKLVLGVRTLARGHFHIYTTIPYLHNQTAPTELEKH